MVLPIEDTPILCYELHYFSPKFDLKFRLVTAKTIIATLFKLKLCHTGIKLQMYGNINIVYTVFDCYCAVEVLL